MPVSAKKFFAAKVNVNENIWSSNVELLISKIPEAIKRKAKRKTKNWTWTFTDIGETDNGIIYGNISKFRKEKRQVVTDHDTTGIHEIPNASYSAFFVYDPKYEILLFQENSRITKDEFLKMFPLLVYSGDVTIGNLKIILFQGDDNLYQKLLGYDVITKIEFDIIPPNFIGREELGDLYDIMMKANGTHLQYAVENKNGINTDGPFIKSGIKLVERAYGYAKSFAYNIIYGKDRYGRPVERKERVRFSTKDVAFHQWIHSDDPKDIIEELDDLYNRSLKRITKGSDDKNVK